MYGIGYTSSVWDGKWVYGIGYTSSEWDGKGRGFTVKDTLPVYGMGRGCIWYRIHL